MSDEGRNPQTRRFEPPPWEREQFEELARKRAEEERARAPLEQPAQRPPEAEPTSPAAAPEPDALAAAAPGEAEVGRDAEDAPAVSDAQIEAMLIQLSGEEPTDRRGISRAGKWVAFLVGLVGLAIVGMAVAQGARNADAGPVAGLAAAVGVLFGGGIAGIAIWLWIRAARLQGS